MLSFRHSSWFFYLLGYGIFISSVYAEMPSPRVWVMPTTHDGITQSRQISLRFHSTLKEYMNKSKRVKVEDGKASKRRTDDSRVTQAESSKYSGIELFREGKYEEAQKILLSSLKGYQQSVSSIRDLTTVFQTLIYLAAAYEKLEYGEDAKDYYRQLAAIAPESFEISADIPKKIVKKYKKEYKRLNKKKKGGVSLKSTEGATVFIDGVERCKIPCQVRDLTRGFHYVRLTKEGVGKAGGLVKVKGGSETEMTYTLGKKQVYTTAVLVSPKLIKKISDGVSQGQLTMNVRVAADEIAQEQDVNYVLMTHILSKKRKLTLFAYLYDQNRKEMIAFTPKTFKANFSATKITAMKFVKDLERGIKTFPKDQVIDGAHAPMVAMLTAAQTAAKNAELAAKQTVTPPKKTTKPSTPKPKKRKMVASRRPFSSTTKQIKPPDQTKTDLLPSPRVFSSPSIPSKKRGWYSSPWFWTTVGVIVVGGVSTGAYFMMDSQSKNQRFESKVCWRC